MSDLSTLMSATLALGGSLPGLPRVRRRRYGAWTIPGARESARLAWRARVDAATIRAKSLAFVHPLGMLTSSCPGCIALHEWQAALSAPKPWRSPRRPDPRRRYSRSHRRGCRDCIEMTGPTPLIDRLASGCRSAGWTSALRDLLRGFRDPHGRRS